MGRLRAVNHGLMVIPSRSLVFLQVYFYKICFYQFAAIFFQ